MSKGGIDAFLRNLFQSEGGTNPKVENRYGYIGKYQFGEDALVDLGYYKPDGTRNRTPDGKFQYDWAGEWTGKHGVTCKEDFLGSESVQDRAAREWVKLLCSRSKRFKLQQYIGQTIADVKVTESGIIAAAHLRGFGSEKSPGVRQFLASNGVIDARDANGTSVSKYMRLFAGYDLGCCGSVTAVLTDKDKRPIAGLDYQIKVGSKIAAKGKTNAKGATTKVQGLDAGAQVTILVKRLEGGFKEIKSFIAREQTALVATLSSATRMVTTQLEKHIGMAGEYKRRSEIASQKKAAPLPVKAPMPALTTPAVSNTSLPRTQQGSTQILNGPEKSNEAKDANALATSQPVTDLLDESLQTTDSDVKIPSSGNGKIETDEQEKVSTASTEGNLSENEDGDGVPYPEHPVMTEASRNESGHPVAVMKLDDPSPAALDPGVQKLEEILRRNVFYGKKEEALSGPVAAEKLKKGEPISAHKKRSEESLGRCYKYVKIALLASGMTKRYLGQEAARHAGPELKKEGFRNLLDNSDHGLRSPYDAPIGAVIVYDVTDGTPWGHIEVRISDGFASDYFSKRPRTALSSENKETATMSGRNRKVSGIWAKG